MPKPDLDAYLARIGYGGSPSANLATLREIHRRHLLSITYENLDVQLGVPLDTDPARAFDKIVTRRRGGWCYEMNGVLAWALEEIGFEITKVAGGVARALRGDAAIGNHLVLLADLEERWVVDTGFGDGFLEPIPLRDHHFTERGFDFYLEARNDGFWRLNHHQFGAVPSFDFTETPADGDLLSQQCEFLQTSPESPFVRVLVCQRFTESGYEIQTGLVAKTVSPTEANSTKLDSFDQFQDRLATVFGLTLPAADAHHLYERAAEAHDSLFPA